MAGSLSTFTSLTVYGYPVPERSEATPGLFNNLFSGLSANLDTLNSSVSQFVNLSSVGTAQVVGGISTNTLAVQSGVTIAVLNVLSHNTIAAQSGNTIVVQPYSTALVTKSIDSGGQVFDVRAFGAIGNNITDDTAAIQSALSAAMALGGGYLTGEGATVFFPPGKYLIKSQLTISAPILLRGYTNEGSALNFNLTSANTCLTWNNATNPIRAGFGIRDLGLWGQGTSDGQTLLSMVNCAGMAFENVSFGGALGVQRAFSNSFTSSWNLFFQHCFFSNCSSAFDNTNASQAGEQMLFHHCTFAGNTSSASNAIVLADNAGDFHFYMCAFDTSQVSITNGRMEFIGCHFEDPNSGLLGSPMLVANSGVITFIGCQVTSKSTLTAIIVTSGNPTIKFYGTYAQGPAGNSPALVSISSAGARISFNNFMSSHLFQVNSLFTGLTSAETANILLTSANSSSISGALNVTGNFSCSTVSIMDTAASVGIAFPSNSALRTGAAGQNVYWDVGTLNVRNGDANGNTGGIVAVYAGAAATPSFTFTAEPKLGWYRSAASGMGLSYGQLELPLGTALAPSLAFSSESSLGLYSSGVSTLALSYGTFNLNQARLASVRTLAASAVTLSAAKTNVAVNEVVFTIGGASGASLVIMSGGTAYIFNSAISAAQS